MTECTWSSLKTGKCHELGTVPQLDKRGMQWACLCAGHDLQLLTALSDPRKTLGAWIAAQGGASAAAARMRS